MKKRMYTKPETSIVSLRIGELLEGGIKVASGEEHGGFGAKPHRNANRKYGSTGNIPRYSVWEDE